MNKNDKQSWWVLSSILAIGVIVSFFLKMTNLMLVFMAVLIFVVVQQLSRFEKRLQKLEQHVLPEVLNQSRFPWLGSMIFALFVAFMGAFWNNIWVLGLAISFGLFSLVQVLSHFNRRLEVLEQYKMRVNGVGTQTNLASTSVVKASHETSSVGTQADAALQRSHEPARAVGEARSDSSEQILTTKVKQASESSWWQPAIDWLLHGNPILRVAIAILMIGVVLLLRFASEYWLLTLSIKLFAIAAIGALLTGLGFYLRSNNAVFGIALQGAGLAVIFLTLIFAHHYLVIPTLSLASFGFVVLLLTTIALSLRQNAVYLAILALSMAYLAPLLIPQFRPDSIFLFSYYLLINLAVAVMNFIKPWKILNQIAFVATGFIAGTFIVLYADQAQYQRLDFILWLHILLFIWLSVRYSQLIQKEYHSLKDQQAIRLPPLLDVGLIFSVPILGFSLHAFLMHQSSVALTWGTVLLGIIYAGLAFWIKHKQSELSVLAKSFFILASAFIALIFPLWQGAHWTAVGWVVQGTALIVWGVSERYRVSRYVGIGLIVLSSLMLFYQIWSEQQFPMLSASIYSIAQFIAAYYLLKLSVSKSNQQHDGSNILGSVFLLLALSAGAAVWVEFFALQHDGLGPYLASFTLLLLVFSIFMQFVNLKWTVAQLCISTLIMVLGYTVLFEQGLLGHFEWLNYIQQYSILLTVVSLGLVLVLMQKALPRSDQFHLWWAGLLWLALAAIGPSIWPNGGIVALALAPVLYSLCLYRQQHLLLNQYSVWVLSLVWLWQVNLSTQVFAGYYLPLVNPVDFLSLSLLAILLIKVYQYDFNLKPKQVEWTYKILLIITALLVLSSIMVRALHVYFSAPLWGLAIWSNGLVQLSLTLLWMVLAFILMTISSRRHIRQIWFVGAGLLAVVVIKLIGLDLSQSGTLTRVISFIGAGAIMLVISYLAPLPPVLPSRQKNDLDE